MLIKKNRSFILIFVLFSFSTVVLFRLLFNSNSVVPEINVNQLIDYEDATIQNKAVHSNNRVFPIQEPSSSDKLWLESSIVNQGKYSLGFNLEGNDNRVETRVVDIPNNTSELISFSVYFDESFYIPTNWTVFAQWWQGAPASPPIAFEIAPKTKEFQLRILTRHGPHEKEITKFQYNEKIERGKWHDFIVEMRIDDTGSTNGLLNVWLNGNQIVDYKGPLGYPDLHDETNFRFGLYRYPYNQKRAAIYFDNIQIGKRKANS